MDQFRRPDQTVDYQPGGIQTSGYPRRKSSGLPYGAPGLWPAYSHAGAYHPRGAQPGAGVADYAGATDAGRFHQRSGIRADRQRRLYAASIQVTHAICEPAGPHLGTGPYLRSKKQNEGGPGQIEIVAGSRAGRFPKPSRQLNEPVDSLKMLDDARGAHSSADAHGDHAVASVAALQFAHNRSSKLCASAAERMPKCDGAAIGIHLFRVQSGLLNHG